MKKNKKQDVVKELTRWLKAQAHVYGGPNCDDEFYNGYAECLKDVLNLILTFRGLDTK